MFPNESFDFSSLQYVVFFSFFPFFLWHGLTHSSKVVWDFYTIEEEKNNFLPILFFFLMLLLFFDFGFNYFFYSLLLFIPLSSFKYRFFFLFLYSFDIKVVAFNIISQTLWSRSFIYFSSFFLIFRKKEVKTKKESSRNYKPATIQWNQTIENIESNRTQHC